jgi:hypothetical protein
MVYKDVEGRQYVEAGDVLKYFNCSPPKRYFSEHGLDWSGPLGQAIEAKFQMEELLEDFWWHPYSAKSWPLEQERGPRFDKAYRMFAASLRSARQRVGLAAELRVLSFLEGMQDTFRIANGYWRDYSQRVVYTSFEEQTKDYFWGLTQLNPGDRNPYEKNLNIFVIEEDKEYAIPVHTTDIP